MTVPPEAPDPLPRCRATLAVDPTDGGYGFIRLTVEGTARVVSDVLAAAGQAIVDDKER